MIPAEALYRIHSLDGVLSWCAGWSAPLLLACNKVKFSRNEAHILPDRIFTSPKREIIKASAANLIIKIYKEKKSDTVFTLKIWAVSYQKGTGYNFHWILVFGYSLTKLCINLNCDPGFIIWCLKNNLKPQNYMGIPCFKFWWISKNRCYKILHTHQLLWYVSWV